MRRFASRSDQITIIMITIIISSIVVVIMFIIVASITTCATIITIITIIIITYDEMVLHSMIALPSSVALSLLFLCWRPIQAVS